MKNALHNLINLRGNRQQAFEFAMGKYRDPNSKRYSGMRSCFTRGCEIFTPLSHSLKDVELSKALSLERMINGEDEIDLIKAKILLGDSVERTLGGRTAQ